MKRNARKMELSKNFAQKLLDYQIEYRLSDKPSKETVKNLIELYSEGVEYYESVRSHKYLYFQLKMNEIFMSAATITAISDNSVDEADSPLKKKMRSAKEQQKISAIQFKQKQQKMQQEVLEDTSERVTVHKVKEIINSSDLKSLEAQEKVKQELSSQDDKLKQKLQQRKSRAMLSKSFSLSGVGETQTKDTLFSDPIFVDQRNPNIEIKPIEVNFESVINENSSDEEESEMPMPDFNITLCQSSNKKTRSDAKLF